MKQNKNKIRIFVCFVFVLFYKHNKTTQNKTKFNNMNRWNIKITQQKKKTLHTWEKVLQIEI